MPASSGSATAATSSSQPVGPTRRRKFYEVQRRPARRSRPKRCGASPSSMRSRPPSEARPPTHGRAYAQSRSLPLVAAMKTWLEARAQPHPAARRPRRCHPLRPDPLGRPLPLPRRRPHRTRQQHGRARHPAHRARPQEPSVRRLRWRRRPLGDRRLAHRHRKAQRRRAVRLSQGRARAHVQRPSDEPARRPAALELGPPIAAAA